MASAARVSDSVRLRPWQHAALVRFLDGQSAEFLAVPTPGAAKTAFALVATRVALAERPAPVVVVTPTAHLKTQLAQAAARLRLHLDPAWSAGNGRWRSQSAVAVSVLQRTQSPSISWDTTPASSRRNEARTRPLGRTQSPQPSVM